MTIKLCTSCGESKSLDLFGNNRRYKDGKQRCCKICQARSDKRYYTSNYQKHRRQRERVQQRWINCLDDLKKQGECVKCGEKRFFVLDYHHVDPRNKAGEVANIVRRSFQKAQLETTKCVLLCANCHREFHYLEKTNGMSLQRYIGDMV